MYCSHGKCVEGKETGEECGHHEMCASFHRDSEVVSYSVADAEGDVCKEYKQPMIKRLIYGKDKDGDQVQTCQPAAGESTFTRMVLPALYIFGGMAAVLCLCSLVGGACAALCGQTTKRAPPNTTASTIDNDEHATEMAPVPAHAAATAMATAAEP